MAAFGVFVIERFLFTEQYHLQFGWITFNRVGKKFHKYDYTSQWESILSLRKPLRSLNRTRFYFMRDLRRSKKRIKSFLQYYRVPIPLSVIIIYGH
jgi:hypothetical protein